MRKIRHQNLALLLVSAAASEFLYLLMAQVENLRAHIPVFIFYYLLLFGLYWLAAQRVFTAANQSESHRASTKKVLIIGIGFAVLFRITMLLSPPALSDDIYRYVWDGRVANSGINPYLHPPAADELAPLRDDHIYPKINHKDIPTIYPPLSQVIFQIVYKIHPSLTAFKIALLGFDLLTMAVVFLILRHLAIDLRRGLLYAWNPLAIVEISGSGHADIIGVFFLMLSLWLLFKKRPLFANISLALSFLSKIFSAMLWPIYFFTQKKNKIALALMFLIFAAAFYWPYAGAGRGLFTGLLIYGEKWQFNASIFWIILSAVKALLPESWIVRWMIAPYGYTADAVTLDSRGTDLALMIAKGLVALVFAAMFCYYLLRLKKDVERAGPVWLAKLSLILLGSFFLLSPTVQPWYLCWLLPFLALAPSRPWLLLTGLVALSYWQLIEYDRSGLWQELLWVKLVEYLPFYLLLVWDFWKGKQRG